MGSWQRNIRRRSVPHLPDDHSLRARPAAGEGSETLFFCQPIHFSQQTSDGLLKVGATCKHFAGYSLEQWAGISRFEFDAQISARDMTETYLPAFRACVDAEVASVMCSYNLINGAKALAAHLNGHLVIRTNTS
jgi:hypothetical protein